MFGENCVLKEGPTSMSKQEDSTVWKRGLQKGVSGGPSLVAGPKFIHSHLHNPSRVVTGKSLDSPENGNVDKMSEKCRNNVEKCPKNVQKWSGGAENTIFGHFLDKSCLFGPCFCWVTLSNACPLQF